MQLTTRTDYSLRVLLYLSLHPDRTISTPEIASAYGISQHHLAKIGNRLTKEGWVKSTRGKQGGMRLVCLPSDLSIGHIVRILENRTLVECFRAEGNTCPISSVCKMRGALDEAQKAFLGVLDRYSLEEVSKERAPLLNLLRPLK